MSRATLAAALMVLAAVVATYGNHFHNAFHFDDFHTITGNPYIRHVSNVPRFFTDPKTFSTLPAHQSYRPLVTTSIAIDYRLGKGPDPFYFHLSTFVLYLALLILIHVLFMRLMDVAKPAPMNRWFALFGTALYGLHPVSAETVNYIVQRAEVQSTAGVVAGLVLYICAPRLRRSGLYLVPVALGMLAKPPAAVFAGILFLYILLFEEDWNFRRTLIRCIPAVLVCIAVAAFVMRMERGMFSPGGASRLLYRLTQPIVTWHYFRSFFWPSDLSADSDFQLVTGFRDPRMIAGLLFVLLLCTAAWWTARERTTRPIAFGLAWFLLALAPVAWVPLAEVANDHRMFFPFIGLTLAMVWVARLIAARHWRLLAVAGVLVLVACSYGTRERNEVWRTEETLWEDVALKSPRNGRGLMNYGLTQMQNGEYDAALASFRQALQFTPDYALLHVNLGVVEGALGRDAQAESYFKRALELDPRGSQGYVYYARWLAQRGRPGEAVPLLETGLAMNPADLQCRTMLLELYSKQEQGAKLDALVDDSLRLLPNDPDVLKYRHARPEQR